jgi:RNA polymerase sigma-70 factor (sigma-E family)
MTPDRSEGPVNHSAGGGVNREMNATESALPDATVVVGADEAKTVVARMYREHYATLVRAVALLVRDASEAEDIVQEAHLKLYRSWDRVRDPDSAPGYLRTTALNLARSRLRTVIRARGRHEEPRDTTPPDEAAIAGEASSSVIRALKALPRRQRECLVLRHYLELSDREIAADIGISIGSVKRHVHRGLEKLERSLERYR